MWNEQQRQRFQELRQRPSQLTDSESAELTLLQQELEAHESTCLTPAIQRLRQEREQAEQHNRSLEQLAERRHNLVQRLESVLAEARAERNAIERELASVLAGSSDSHGQG